MAYSYLYAEEMHNDGQFLNDNGIQCGFNTRISYTCVGENLQANDSLITEGNLKRYLPKHIKNIQHAKDESL